MGNYKFKMTSHRDKATNQMEENRKTIRNPGMITTGAGCPVGDKTNSMTVGPRGPILLQDHVLIDELAHFDRERIPERVVHAKGAGAFGYFEVTHDITKYCKAAVFSEIGKQTPLACRWSTVGGESGSADTARDPRGFSLKFYSEEGNWDLVGNNTPIFFHPGSHIFPQFYSHSKKESSHSLERSRYVLGFHHFEAGNYTSSFFPIFGPWNPCGLPLYEWLWITHFQNGEC